MGSLVRRAQSGQRAGETPSEAGLRLIPGGSSGLWSQEMLLLLGTVILEVVLQGNGDTVWGVTWRYVRMCRTKAGQCRPVRGEGFPRILMNGRPRISSSPATGGAELGHIGNGLGPDCGFVVVHRGSDCFPNPEF